MAFEEKRAWIMIIVTTISYAVYAAIILGRVDGDTTLTQVPYAATMLWTIGIAIVSAIVLHILVSIVTPEGANQKDQRDREINRFGEYIGQSFVVLGGVLALIMAMLELDYFWIANVIYLAFALSSVLASAAKVVAYRRGFQDSW